MAYDVNKLARLSHLKSMAEAAKIDYTAKIGVVDKKIDDQIKATNAVVAKAFKSGKVDGNTVNLYTSDNMTGDAAFSFDFPIEMVLDQAKTAFVPKFAFSEETYTGATNPKLEGKPVMVLAVKGSDGSVTYSFLNMATLVDTYTAKAGDGSATVTVEGYEITVNVEVSAKEGNLLQKDESGKLFVSVDQTDKADKVKAATKGHIAALDENGNLTDAGIAKDDVVTKVVPAAVGNIATLGTDGKLVDSGVLATEVVLKEAGKGLSTEDYTTEEKNKLKGISEGANKTEVSTTNGYVKVDGTEVKVYELPTDVVKDDDIKDVVRTGNVATDAEVTEMLKEVFPTE